MIFVTVGTHHQPFDRLVEAAASLCEFDEVVVQRGPSTVTPAGCRVFDAMRASDWHDHVDRARLVITHGGPASIFAALETGVPIVVPRRRIWCEHVDDHQMRFAERMIERVRVVWDLSGLRSEVEQALAEALRPGNLRDRTELSRTFSTLIDGLV